jgi:site-specific recombinase XerD
MKSKTTSHLYQYKNSSNYFFRIRNGFFKRSRYHIQNSYFIASLHTDCLEHAKWLALFIRMQFEKDMERNNMDNIQKANTFECIEGPLAPWGDEVKSFDLEYPFIDDFTKQRFKLQLKERYKELLASGKRLIDQGFDVFNNSACLINEDDVQQIKVTPDNQSVVIQNTSHISGVTQLGTTDPETVEHLYKQALNMNTLLMTKLMQHESGFLAADNDTTEMSFEGNAKLFDLLRAQKGLSEDVGDEISKNEDVKKVKLVELVAQKELVQTLTQAEQAQPIESDKHFSFDEQYQSFKLEKGKDITVKTLIKYDNAFAVFFKKFGKEMDCRTFTKKHMLILKKDLITRYVNENKGCRKILLSTKTINSYLSNYRSFYSWFIKNNDGEMNNPFDRVSIKESKKGKIKRRPFVANEITKILNYQFGRPDEARGYKKEALLYLKVATYTGMRLNEIACIPLANIVQIDGVWVFDLHGIDVKNEPSERIVPIAQKLLDLGMLEFIADCRRKRNKYLFEEVRKHVCNPEVKGYGDPISRWFNRTVLKNIGINKAEEKANKKVSVVNSTPVLSQRFTQ